jgi:RNA recognition motif-containing protein
MANTIGKAESNRISTIEKIKINSLFCDAFVNISLRMNIFVARLNFKTRSEDLEKAFAQFGQVTSAKIVKDRDTGRSKGYGFVEMANEEDGKRAIAALNETELDGRTIVVKPANPKGTTGAGSEG